PGTAERRGTADLGADRDDHHLRHALDPGGRVPVDPGGGHDSPARPHRRCCGDRPAAAAHRRDTRKRALLRAGDGGARATAWPHPDRIGHPREGGGRHRLIVRRWLPAAIVLVGVLALWQLLTQGTGRHVIPPPSSIVGAMVDQWNLVLYPSAQATVYEAL